MNIELLSAEEMAEADRRAIAAGPLDGVGLMRNAGQAVAALVLARFPAATRVHVLCGPGNNGGDGYVAATILNESAATVSVWASARPREGSDAALVAAQCRLPVRPLDEFAAKPGDIVVDGLYGAGLSRPLRGVDADVIRKISIMQLPVVAIDLPSGVSGDGGAVMGEAFHAAVTVTFARRKPGHLLLPGRELCGEVVVADIGIDHSIVASLATRTFANCPTLWLDRLPSPAVDAHKYKRGHVGVFSGGPHATGAARLSALAAARAGAGAVTLLSPGPAMQVNAVHLTSIMLRRMDDTADVTGFIGARRPSALVIGPGFGVGEKAREFVLAILHAGGSQNDGEASAVPGLVCDADAITSFRDRSQDLFEAAGKSPTALVLTPHEGEFSRLFPDLATDGTLSKVEKARRAASRAGAIIVYKGPDTVIAAPDGRAAINSNGSPWLATAGSGDVLTGIAAAFLAQGMPAFEAACAAVWTHGEAGSRFGPGLIAEDLPLALVPVLRELLSPVA